MACANSPLTTGTSAIASVGAATGLPCATDDAVGPPAGFTGIELNTPAQPVTFHWKKFIDAASDAGMSRRYGGIHFKDGDLEGRKLGKKIAAIVFKKTLGQIDGKLK